MAELLFNFSDDQIDVIYKATHLTETLNKKLATALPPGIYRGFSLSASGVTDQINIDPDPSGDGHIAVVENEADRSITIRRDGGSFPLGVNSLRGAGTRKFVIAVWGKYSKGSVTSAQIRAYETYPTNSLLTAPEADTLAILGEVTLVGAGAAPVAAEDVSAARRTSAWQNIAPEGGLWKPLLHNSSFELASDALLIDDTISGWEQSWSGCAVGASQLDARSGSRCLFVTAFATSGVTFAISQEVGEPVSPDDRVRVRGFFKALQLPSAGGVECELTFAGSTGAALTLVTVPITINGVSADWEEFGAIVSPPAGAAALIRAELKSSVPISGSATPLFYFDDLQVWKSWNGADRQEAARLGYRADASPRRVWFPTAAYGDTTAPYLQRSASELLGTPTLDLQQGNFRARNSLGVGDDLVQSLSDAAIARLALPHRANSPALTLLMESLPHSGTDAAVRYYADHDGNLLFTRNAKFTDIDEWAYDDDDDPAVRVQITAQNGLEISYREGSLSATFTDSEWRSYLDFHRTHLLAETEWIDAASLWEVEESAVAETSPYTCSVAPGTSGSGVDGWIIVGNNVSEGSVFDVITAGDLAYCTSVPGGQNGWYVVKAVSTGHGTGMQVQLADIDTNSNASFGTLGDVVARFYQGAFLGRPRGAGAKGLVIDAGYGGDHPLLVRERGQYGGDVAWIDAGGNATAQSFQRPSNFSYTEILPINAFVPGANTDWTPVNEISGTFYLSSVGTTDHLVSQLPLRPADELKAVYVRVLPGVGAMTLRVIGYTGTTIDSDTTTGTSEQYLSCTGLSEIIDNVAPIRIVVTSGQASDRVYRAQIQYHRPSL